MVALGALLLALALAALPQRAEAAEEGKIRLGYDYDIFVIGGTDHRPCEQACLDDPRCKSWTFLKTIGQCRLKHSVAPASSNGCCVSDVKRDKPEEPDRDEFSCADFATAALRDNDANLANQCGYTGPQWAADYRKHYSHCLDISPRRREAESRERSASLEDCRKLVRRAAEIACDHYARMSVAEQQTNKERRCGFRGPGWSDDLKEHVSWCKSAERTEIDDSIEDRERRLARCLSRGGGDEDPGCKRYAQVSVQQYRNSQDLRCGPSYAGPFWHADFAQHYEWCKRHDQTERDKWVRAREKGLRECEKERVRKPKFILKF